jgi:hypothetical protein
LRFHPQQIRNAQATVATLRNAKITRNTELDDSLRELRRCGLVRRLAVDRAYITIGAAMSGE